jgi:TusA-related sulfurtransferase
VKEKADYTLDVRGTISPFSLLKVSLLFQRMKPQEVVEILGCEPEMHQDLLRLLPDAACETLPDCANGKELPIARVRLRKEARRQPDC